MELVYTDGCTVFGLDVDGKDFSDIPIEKQKEICHKIIEQCDSSIMQEFIIDFLNVKGDYNYLYTCEQCGDSVYEYKTIIE